MSRSPSTGCGDPFDAIAPPQSRHRGQQLAAIGGSPPSGGYAGAKAIQRLIARYAQEEAKRQGLGITFSTVLPRLAPGTGVGEPAIRAYDERAGVGVSEYLETFRRSFGPLVAADAAGEVIAALASEESRAIASAYLLTGAGLQKVG